MCVTVIECLGRATFKFGLKKNAGLEWPRYFTGGEEKAKRGYYVAAGTVPDLMFATESGRNMIGWLTTTYGLSRKKASVLCSVAADIRIHELLDQPNWVVGEMISLD